MKNRFKGKMLLSGCMTLFIRGLTVAVYEDVCYNKVPMPALPTMSVGQTRWVSLGYEKRGV